MQKLDKVFRINPLYDADGYKVGHHRMLAPNTVREYWTWIPRSLKYMHPSITKIMSAGQQMVVRYIHSNFKELFFDQPIEVALKFGRDMSKYLGMDYDGRHFEELHKLGYLPIQIQAIPEGVFTDKNVPHMAGINTKDGYAWLGLFLETLFSKLAWQFPTTATIGYQFRKNAQEWAAKTDPDNLWLADFMCHDFHSRGGNPFTSIAVGLAHAFSNLGSDTLNVIEAARYYYDVPEDEVCIYSVNASEHSVTCTGIFYYERLMRRGLANDLIKEYYSYDIQCEGSVENPDYKAIAEWANLRDWLKKFPKGILSVVSDTFDLWKLITFILPRLKKEILAREGKLVIRPDSGDPVDIICGFQAITEEWDGTGKRYHRDDVFEREGDGDVPSLWVAKHGAKPVSINEEKGVIELLWDIFGGTTNKQGFKVLDSHIGAIYGDSINVERQVSMYSRLADKGFASTNIVLGVGSYAYVMLTRDSAGWAAKGAWFEILTQASEPDEQPEREQFDIFKDPVTDDGTKKSLRGFQFVSADGVVESGVSEEKAFSEDNLLKTIYKDGKFFNQVTLNDVRTRIKATL